MRNLYYTLNTDEVDHFINKRILYNLKKNSNYKILHLTPTLILYRKRKQFYKKFFKQFNRASALESSIHLEEHVTVNEFFHWAKDMVYLQSNKPISRNESHVLTKRAINEIVPDSKEWESTSFELMELFLYFQTLQIELNELENISPYDDWATIIRIYMKYVDLLKESGLRDYSQELLRTILDCNILSDYSEVILDGPFLFFEPIHEALIHRCNQLGIPLSFIVPFERKEGYDVNPAYRIIQKIYGLYVPESEWISITGKRTASSYLDQIPSVLFTNQNTKYDDSITINKYTSLEQEVLDVVTAIKKKIDRGFSSINKIAIVTPNSKQLRPLVREIAENVGIEVEVPERPFLGLTAGEFVHFIYKIRTDDRRFEKDSYLDKSIFKRILNSRWFNDAQKTIFSFEAIEEVLLEDIVSIQEWETRLTNLIEIKQMLKEDEFIYHPLHGVAKEDLITWVGILERIRVLQEMVFSLATGTISQHANNLFQALKLIASHNDELSYMEETKMIDRIEKIINGISSQDRIEIHPQEFGDLLFSLFLEQEDFQEGYERESDQDSRPEGILVTSLQNIAFQKYNYIYTIQFTQDNYPIAQKSKWPLHNDILWKLINKTTKLKLRSTIELEKLYADREKYYFYLSFASARIAYGISYARFDKGLPLSPSHYLNDIAKTFGVEESNPLEVGSEGKGEKLEQLLQKFHILKQPNDGYTVNENIDLKEDKDNIYQNEEIHSELSLDEIGIYKLCPKRYSYMKLFPKRNIYSTSFQITMYIANELFIRLVKYILSIVKEERLVEEHQNKRVQGKLLKLIPKSIEAEKELFNLFPVSDEVKENAVYYASMFVENYIQLIIDKGQLLTLANQGKAHASIMFDLSGKEKEIELVTEKGIYKINGKRDFAVKLAHFPLRTYSLSHRSVFLNSSKYDLEVLSGRSVATYYQWLNKLKREFFYPENELKIISELNDILKQLEKKEFQKQKGTHCSYCPFYKICLEKESMDEEYDLEEGQEME